LGIECDDSTDTPRGLSPGDEDQGHNRHQQRREGQATGQTNQPTGAYHLHRRKIGQHFLTINHNLAPGNLGLEALAAHRNLAITKCGEVFAIGNHYQRPRRMGSGQDFPDPVPPVRSQFVKHSVDDDDFGFGNDRSGNQ